MKSLEMCLNPKVIGALILVAGLVLIFAPRLLTPILPVLFLAACPLSMLIMAMVMRRHQAPAPPAASAGESGELTRLQTENEMLKSELASGGADATRGRAGQ